MPIPIQGGVSATWETVMDNLPSTTHSRFRAEMMPYLWTESEGLGVDPVGVIAQSGKETNWGNFARADGTPGAVSPWFYNTAGIKVRHDQNVMALLGTTNPDHPLVHQQFPNWQVGALAQVQHLLAYCHVFPGGLLVDPRWTLVFGWHQVVNWQDLNGKWAGPTYGDEVEIIIRRLRGETSG